jgi:hypothetical protein
MVRNECVKFDKDVDKQVNFKILWLKVLDNAQICTIHVTFDRGCLAAVLIENTIEL